MRQIPYNNAEIVDAVRALGLSKRPDIQKLAQETLTTLESV